MLRCPKIVIYAALALTTLAAFWPVLECGFVNYDDPLYVTANPQVQGGLCWPGVRWAFTAQHASNWHPVTWLSHMLDCQLFGLNAGAHHLVNVLFHTVNVLLLFLVLRQMTGALWRSAVVAALFAWHPLQVDTVAWIAERKNVLSTLFWLLTLWAYSRYAEIKVRSPGSSGRGRKWYGLALLFLALGLMSKPMLVTVPCTLLLLDYWPLKRFQLTTAKATCLVLIRLVWEKLPFFALAAASSFMTIAAHRGLGIMDTGTVLPFELRVENALVSYLRYLGKTIWPDNLAILYLHPREWPALTVGACGLLLVVASSLAVWAFRKRSYLFVGWFWFLGVLVPAIGLIQAGEQAMADRFSYVPLIGLFIAVTWGGWEAVQRWPQSRLLAYVAALLALASCLVITRGQLRHWKDSQAVFEHCVRVTPNNFVAHNNLGFALATQGKLEEAKAHYLEALRIQPYYAESLRNMGVVLTQQGKTEEGLRYLYEAVRVKPQFKDVYAKLGLALAAEGRFEEAVARYREALRLKPDWPEAHNNLAWILATHPDEKLRNGAEAVAHAQRACELTRYRVPIMVGTLAAAYAEAGSFDDAIATAQKAHEMALTKCQTELAKKNLELLNLYRSGKPYRELLPSTGAGKP